MRAATARVTAAIAAFIGWMLSRPRQHVADLRFDLGTVSSTSISEGAANR